MSLWLFSGLPFRGIRRASEYRSEDYTIPGSFVPRSVISRNQPKLGMQYPGFGDSWIRRFPDKVLPGFYYVLGILVLGILVLGILVLGICILGICVLGICVLGTGILGRSCPTIHGMSLFIRALLYFCRDFIQLRHYDFQICDLSVQLSADCSFGR
jgi:hypothetical protein